MAYDIKDLINSHLPDGELPNFKHLKIDFVDSIADELVKEYDGAKYRRWYCGIVYEYGPAQVQEWRVRAREGKYPAKLFSKYAANKKHIDGSANEK